MSVICPRVSQAFSLLPSRLCRRHLPMSAFSCILGLFTLRPHLSTISKAGIVLRISPICPASWAQAYTDSPNAVTISSGPLRDSSKSTKQGSSISQAGSLPSGSLRSILATIILDSISLTAASSLSAPVDKLVRILVIRATASRPVSTASGFLRSASAAQALRNVSAAGRSWFRCLKASAASFHRPAGSSPKAAWTCPSESSKAGTITFDGSAASRAASPASFDSENLPDPAYASERPSRQRTQTARHMPSLGIIGSSILRALDNGPTAAAYCLILKFCCPVVTRSTTPSGKPSLVSPSGCKAPIRSLICAARSKSPLSWAQRMPSAKSASAAPGLPSFAAATPRKWKECPSAGSRSKDKVASLWACAQSSRRIARNAAFIKQACLHCLTAPDFFSNLARISMASMYKA
mmetsp:Transcript_47165/g.106875  ORF Transcript_47165/g.106875 Transcript_47165/m.106875 type:complete len:409 (+) Transcript_47165:367-1593(+)